MKLDMKMMKKLIKLSNNNSVQSKAKDKMTKNKSKQAN